MQRLKRIAPYAVMLAIWLGLMGWWRFTSLTVAYNEHYPTGKLKLRGLVKRQSDSEYKRHGSWTEFHPNGLRKSQTDYKDGEQLAPTRYWDERGQPVAATQSGTN